MAKNKQAASKTKDKKKVISKTPKAESKKSPTNKLSLIDSFLIKTYKHETIRLKKEIDRLTHETNGQFVMLNKIYHSRTWRLLGIYKHFFEEPLLKFLRTILPLALRKRLKSKAQAIILPKPKQIVPNEIMLDWTSFKRDANSIDLINFGIIAWNFRFQRPQQIATQIAHKNNRVFYIKNEFIPGTVENGYAPFTVEKISERIYEITLSASRNLFIYSDQPSEKDIEVIIASLKNLINSANIINPVAKIDHPFWAYLLNKLSMPTIYDCMDNHQGFSDSGSNLSSLEQTLFKKADVTIVTSHYLLDVAHKNKAKNITLVPNAGDFNHFSEAAKRTKTTPDDLKNVKGTIIGYYGAIADWFDTTILENLAKNHSDKSIVLIGQVTNPKVESLAKKYKNIYLLGEKKYQELPIYLSHFDVCIIPFIINELIKATHPVKVYEYLAAGKPVVATKMPEIKDLSDTVILSSSVDFSKNVTTALKTKNNNLAGRQLIARNNTWTTRSSQLLGTISKLLFPKISIIILSYNHPDLMKLTIDSVLKRSFYPNMEVIVVDNNSSSETVELLKKYKNVPNVKLILNSVNYGFAKGNNIGLEAATGEYLVLLNNDVIATPGWLSKMLFHLKKDGVGLVGPVTNSIGNEAKIDITYDHSKTEELESRARAYTSEHWGETLNLHNIAAFCWIMSKATYKKLGGLDEIFGRGMFEDDDYCYRILKNNQKILVAEDTFIHHFGGSSFKQIQSDEYIKLFNDNKKKFEDKWKIKWTPHQYRKQ